MVAPISVCMIVRNEAVQLKSCLQSLRPYVREICIVDTGSTDDTPKIAKAFADKFEVFTGCNDAENKMLRFDVARNRSFSLASQPWVLWADGDDEIVGGERLETLCEMLDIKRKGEPCAVLMRYDYASDAQGRVLMKHDRERLLTRGDFTWKGWVHEVAFPNGPYKREREDGVYYVHHPLGKSQESGRNLRILRAQRKAEGDQDPRLLYYLGMELRNNNHPEESIEVLTKYLGVTGWPEEGYMAALLICEQYQRLGRLDDAISFAFRAVALRPDWDQAYFDLAKAYYHKGHATGDVRHWEKTAFFAKQGLSLPPMNTELFVNPAERAFEVHRYLNFALSKTGDVPGAIRSLETALRYKEDENLRHNLGIYIEWQLKEEAKSTCKKLESLGKLSEEVSSFLQIR